MSFGIYLDASNSYIISDSNLDIGDKPLNSFAFISEKIVRGKTISSHYNFKFKPLGAILNEDDEILVFYKDSKDNWFRDTFSNKGVFKETTSYSLTDLLVDELKYSTDLNADGEIGDVIKSVFGSDGINSLYKSASNAFLIDDSNLIVGDLTINPTILTQQVTLRGKTTTSLHKFSSDPTGMLSFKDGSGVGVYYQDSKGAWKRDSFDNDGVFKQTDSLTINEVLTDEAIYDLDLDGDGNIGDTISAVYMNVPDADAGVEDKSDNFGLYKTATGSYIADTADLAVGDYADEPTLLIKQTVSRGKTSTSLYDFKYTPTGAVAYAEGGGSVYYRDTKGKWFRDNFSDDGVFQTTDSLTLSEVRNEEAVHDLDLDGDGVVGDTIAETYFNVPDSNVEVDDLKDNWGLYKTETNAYLIDVSDLYTGSQTVSPTILTNENVLEGKLQNLYINLNIYQYQLLKMMMVITLYLIKIKKMTGIFMNLIKKVYFKIVKNIL